MTEAATEAMEAMEAAMEVTECAVLDSFHKRKIWLLYFTLLYFIRPYTGIAVALGPCTMRAGEHVTRLPPRRIWTMDDYTNTGVSVSKHSRGSLRGPLSWPRVHLSLHLGTPLRDHMAIRSGGRQHLSLEGC